MPIQDFGKCFVVIVSVACADRPEPLIEAQAELV